MLSFILCRTAADTPGNLVRVLTCYDVAERRWGPLQKENAFFETGAFKPFPRAVKARFAVLKSCVATMLPLTAIDFSRHSQVVSFNDSWTTYSCSYAGTVGDGAASNQARGVATLTL